MDRRSIASTMRRQALVISRAQVHRLGGSDADIERLLRRREWARVHPGVYVGHTGQPTWEQRAWAAVLHTGLSALGGRSALRAHGLRGHEFDGAIQVVVPDNRHLTPSPGIELTRSLAFDRVAQLHLSPPRVRVESALIKVASLAPSDDAAVGVLADACQQHRTTVARLHAELTQLQRLPRRRLINEVLDDLGSGACSALERRYLRDVERAHRLPRAERQVRAGKAVRDAVYALFAVIVELDGRLGHEWTADKAADTDRDIDALVAGMVTVRVGWRQVLAPCALADRVGRILTVRGWAAGPQRCGATCTLPSVLAG